MITTTAYITTDPTALSTGAIDVTVLEVDEQGMSGRELFSAATSVSVDGDHQAAVAEAAELLVDARWRVTGAWETVTSGYQASVERTEP